MSKASERETRERAREDVANCRRQLGAAIGTRADISRRSLAAKDWRAANVGVKFMRAALALAIDHAVNVGAIARPCRAA